MPDRARVHKVRCVSCGREFNALYSRLCDCVSDERTFRCTNCAACFCEAPEAFRKQFWRDAPDELWAQRQRDAAREPDQLQAPARPIVVVADDSPAVRAQIARAIAVVGVRVYTAADGTAALKLVREHAPEMLLTDALMPGLDGREVARLAKGLSPDTRTVVVTGVYRSPRYRGEALREYAVDEYVTKPVPAARMRELVLKYAFATQYGKERRVGRVFPARPLAASVAGRGAFVVDISLQGLRLTHDFPIAAAGERIEVTLTSEAGAEIPLECAVVWTSALLRTNDGTAVQQSGLRITSADPALRPLVQQMVQEEIERLQANARGVPPSPQDEARRAPAELIRHDLTGRGWTTTRTTDPAQPAHGFTIRSDVTPVEVQQLRQMFLTGGADERRLIQTLAQLSVGA